MERVAPKTLSKLKSEAIDKISDILDKLESESGRRVERVVVSMEKQTRRRKLRVDVETNLWYPPKREIEWQK